MPATQHSVPVQHCRKNKNSQVKDFAAFPTRRREVEAFYVKVVENAEDDVGQLQVLLDQTNTEIEAAEETIEAIQAEVAPLREARGKWSEEMRVGRMKPAGSPFMLDNAPRRLAPMSQSYQSYPALLQIQLQSRAYLAAALARTAPHELKWSLSAATKETRRRRATGYCCCCISYSVKLC